MSAGAGPEAGRRLGRPLAAAFGALAQLRSGPAIHTVGTTYAATLEVSGGAGTGLPLLDRPAVHRVLVRFSRGLGLPHQLPDVHGLALRIDAGPRPQDLLLDTCGTGPVGRHAVRLARDIGRGPYGTLIAYCAGSRQLHLAAFADDRSPGPRHRSRPRSHEEATGLVFALALASPWERGWHRFGRLVVGEPVARPRLRFSPVNDGLGVSMRRDWVAFRRGSYLASQQHGPRSGQLADAEQPETQLSR
jgi:hypothetical protein